MMLETDEAGADTGAPSFPAGAGLAMALLSGCLLAVGYSLDPAWWAVWIAPAPVLAAALVSRPLLARPFGLIAGLVAGISTATYYLEVVGPTGTIIVLIAHAVFWGETVQFAASSVRRGWTTPAVFALPTFGAAVETLIVTFSPHGSAGSLANSQMDRLPIVQIAALGGTPAIVFLVLCAGSLGGLVLARLLGAPVRSGTLIGAAVLVVLLTGGALSYGTSRLGQPVAGPKVHVAVISTDQFARIPNGWADVWRAYAPAVVAAATPGAIIVLPEKIAHLSEADVRLAESDLAAVARDHHVTLVVGVERDAPFGQMPNTALFVTADGQVSLYDKQHLVPGAEARNKPGTRDFLASVGDLLLGVAICKDMHIPSLGRGYARSGAQLMLVPAWDFERDAWMSSRLTMLRSVEGGFSIARAAREGISSLSDPFGRIVAEGRSSNAVSVVQADLPVPPRGTATLYSRFGDVFGWLCVVLVVLTRVFLRAPRASALTPAMQAAMR